VADLVVEQKAVAMVQVEVAVVVLYIVPRNIFQLEL
jgi:hypothetical protein